MKLVTVQAIESTDQTVKLFSVFSGLNHNLTWMQNDDVNRVLFQHYKHWFCVYDDFDHMNQELQYFINEMSDYWNKRWDAYQLEFNPLWNVDATVETCRKAEYSAHNNGSSTNNNHQYTENIDTGKEDTSQYGYNETSPTKTGLTANNGTNKNTTNGGTSGTTVQDSTERNRECESVRRAGNIGVTSSVQLLTEYRDKWIQSVIGDYIKCFADFFILA